MLILPAFDFNRWVFTDTRLLQISVIIIDAGLSCMRAKHVSLNHSDMGTMGLGQRESWISNVVKLNVRYVGLCAESRHVTCVALLLFV